MNATYPGPPQAAGQREYQDSEEGHTLPRPIVLFFRKASGDCHSSEEPVSDVPFPWSLRHCFCRGLAGIFDGDSRLFATLLSVFD